MASLSAAAAVSVAVLPVLSASPLPASQAPSNTASSAAPSRAMAGRTGPRRWEPGLLGSRIRVLRLGSASRSARRDGEQFDVEHQRGIGTDRAARGSLLAVTELRGDPEAVLRADRHQAQALGPPGNDLAEAEFDRLAAIVGTVEHASVEQRAFVHHPHGVAGQRPRAVALAQHHVLQPGRRGEDALLLAILRQERFSLLRVLLRRLGRAGL